MIVLHCPTSKRWTPSSDSADVSMKSWSKVACLCINVNQKWSIISLPTERVHEETQSSFKRPVTPQCSCMYGFTNPTQQGSNKYNGSLIAWHEWSLEYQREWTVTLASCFIGQSPLGLSMLTTRSSVSVAPLLPEGCWFINIWNNTNKTVRGSHALMNLQTLKRE